jgi:hypothetical protein
MAVPMRKALAMIHLIKGKLKQLTLCAQKAWIASELEDPGITIDQH